MGFTIKQHKFREKPPVETTHYLQLYLVIVNIFLIMGIGWTLSDVSGVDFNQHGNSNVIVMSRRFSWTGTPNT